MIDHEKKRSNFRDIQLKHVKRIQQKLIVTFGTFYVKFFD